MARLWAGGSDALTGAFVPFGGGFGFTIATYFRIPVYTAGDHVFLGVYNSSNDDGFRMGTDWDGSTHRFRSCQKEGGIPQQSANSGFTDTNWHTGIAIFRSSTDRSGYLDGTAANSTGSCALPSVANVAVGCRLAPGVDRNDNHETARVCAWNIDIGATGRTLYNAGVSPWEIYPDNLVFYVEDVRDPVNLVGPQLTLVGTTVATHPRLFYYRMPDTSPMPQPAAGVDGALNVTLDDIALAGTGTVDNNVSGTLNVTLADLALAATGLVGGAISGTLAVTLDNLSLAATGTVPIAGALNVTLGDLILQATGTVPGPPAPTYNPLRLTNPLTQGLTMPLTWR